MARRSPVGTTKHNKTSYIRRSCGGIGGWFFSLDFMQLQRPARDAALMTAKTVRQPCRAISCGPSASSVHIPVVALRQMPASDARLSAVTSPAPNRLP
jgi:hypothetical protein